MLRIFERLSIHSKSMRLILFILAPPDGLAHQSAVSEHWHFCRPQHWLSSPTLAQNPIFHSVYKSLTDNWPLISNYSPNNVYIDDLSFCKPSLVYNTVTQYASHYNLEAFELASYHDRNTLVWTLYKPFKTKQKRRADVYDDHEMDKRSKRINLMLI